MYNQQPPDPTAGGAQADAARRKQPAGRPEAAALGDRDEVPGEGPAVQAARGRGGGQLHADQAGDAERHQGAARLLQQARAVEVQVGAQEGAHAGG